MIEKAIINYNKKYTLEDYAIIYEKVGARIDLTQDVLTWNKFDKKLHDKIIEYTDRFDDDEFEEWFEKNRNRFNITKLKEENTVIFYKE
ncbi:hypothetical protein [Sarcina ventriculi]